MKIVLLITISVILLSCDEDSKPTAPKETVLSMYSLLNVSQGNLWTYDKQITIKREWVDDEPESGRYELRSDDNYLFKMSRLSDNKNSFNLDLSCDSTQLFLNKLSFGSSLAEIILEKLEFKKIKIADLNETNWEIDTLFYEDIQIEDYTFFGYISFDAKRLSDTTVIFNTVERSLFRYDLKMSVIARNEINGAPWIVYPQYSFGLIKDIGFYNIKLINHRNTALKVEEFDYKLKSLDRVVLESKTLE